MYRCSLAVILKVDPLSAKGGRGPKSLRNTGLVYSSVGYYNV